MIAMRGWLLLAGLAASSSCSLETSKAGQACERSTQCAPGLACVKGKCGKDLRSIAAMNTVPMLAAGSGGAAAPAGSGGGVGAAEAGAGGASEADRAGSGAGEGGGS